MNNRLHHLDSLRSALVLAIVVLHAAMAYSQWAVWWYAPDSSSVPGIDVLTLLLDVFPLPVLFFLAGYFAPPSLDARGRWRFVRAKLRRLGLPLVLVCACLIPIIPWIAMTTRNLPVPPLPSYWIDYLSRALVPEAHLVQGMPDYSQYGFQFSQFHVWFISLLLCFFLLYALVPRGKVRREPSNPGRSLSALALAGLLMALAMAGLGTTMMEWSWLNLGWLLFQPVRIPLYLGFFLLGVAAYQGGWLRNGRLPGPLWAWLAASVTMLALFLAVSPALLMTATPLPFHLGLLQSSLRVFFCLAWLGLLLALFQRFAGRPGSMTASLAASSYDIYLMHLPVCVVTQWLLMSSTLAALLKFAIVLAVSTLLPWGLSAAYRSLARKNRPS